MEFTVYADQQTAQRIVWAGKRLTIGRRAGADIQINHPATSSNHAEIVACAQGICIRDLGSRNGTRLNGVRVTESLLRAGDQIAIADAKIVVSAMRDQPRPTPTEAARQAHESWAALPTEKVVVQLDSLRDQSAHALDEDARLLLLRDLFEVLRAVDEVEEVLRKVSEVLQAAFPKARVFVLRPTGKGGWQDPDTPTAGRRPSSTFAAEAANSDSAILSSALAEDTRFSLSESARISGIQTAIATPIRCDGKPLAVLYVDRLGLPPFTQRDLNLIGIAANHVSAVLENVARIMDLRQTNAELDQAQERLARMNRNLEARVLERTTEIRRQAEQINQLSQAKDELLGIAAHDIRGPLTVIQGTVELMKLRQGQLTEATLQRNLELIYEAARGLSQLLSELLDVKAIESGKITVNKVEVEVAHLLADYIPAARLAAEEKNITLTIEAPAGLMICADPQRISQAVTNLLLNAVKFSPAGSRIAVRGRSTVQGEVEIAIEDQGMGIPEEELEQLFDSFQQGRAGRSLGGSGLGLVIARRIVELHAGKLSVVSRVGVGTRFMIVLPASALQLRTGTEA